MVLAAVYVDAKGAVRAWVNAQTDLVGDGHPLQLGAHLHRLRSPASGCYALLSVVGGSPALSAESPAHRARVSAQFYGPTKEAVALAAVAYANAVAMLRFRTPMLGAACLVADDVTGPIEAKDGDEPRHIVDADFYLTPA